MADHYTSSFLQHYGEIYYLNLNELQNHVAIQGQYAIVHSEAYGRPTCGQKCRFISGRCETCPHNRHNATYTPDGSRLFEIETAEQHPVLASASIIFRDKWRDISSVDCYDPIPIEENEDNSDKITEKLVPVLQLSLNFDDEKARSLLGTAIEPPWTFDPAVEESDFLWRTLSSAKGIKAGCTATFGFAIDRRHTFDKSGYSQLAPSETHRRYGFQFCQLQLATPTSSDVNHRTVVIGIRQFPHNALAHALQKELVQPRIARYACNIDQSIRRQHIVPATYNYTDPQRFIYDKDLSNIAPKGTPLGTRHSFAIQEDATATCGSKEKHSNLVVEHNPASVKHSIAAQDYQSIIVPRNVEKIGLLHAPLHMPTDHQDWDANVFEEWLSRKDGRSLVAELTALQASIASSAMKKRIQVKRWTLQSRKASSTAEKKNREARDDSEIAEYLLVEEPASLQCEDISSTSTTTLGAAFPTALDLQLAINSSTAFDLANAYISARLAAEISSVKYRTSTSWKYIPSTIRPRDDNSPKWHKPLSRRKHPGVEYITTPLKNNKRKIAQFFEDDEADAGWIMVEPSESLAYTSPCRRSLEKLDLDGTNESHDDNPESREVITESKAYIEVFEDTTPNEEEVNTDIEDSDSNDADCSFASLDSVVSDDSNAAGAISVADIDEYQWVSELDIDENLRPTLYEDEPGLFIAAPVYEENLDDEVGGNKENIRPEGFFRVPSDVALLVANTLRDF